MLVGADLSNNNGAITAAMWRVIAGSIQFAICKVAEGPRGYFVDPFWPENLAGMQAAGVLPGGYQFARPDLGSAADDYDGFRAGLGDNRPAGLVVALDLERGLTAQVRRALKLDPVIRLPHDMLQEFMRKAGITLESWAYEWSGHCHDDLGCWPALYSSPYFFQSFGLDTARLANDALWIANWGVQTPWIPSNWQQFGWALWQYSDNGRLPGIAGPVDLDYFNGTADRFPLLGIPAPVPPAPPPAGRPFDDPARLETIGYIANGSGVRDLKRWFEQFSE